MPAPKTMNAPTTRSTPALLYFPSLLAASLVVMLTVGPVAAQPLLHALTSPNLEPSGRFGDAVAAIRDLDGDNAPDLLIGAPGEPLDSGRVYVFSGAVVTRIRTLASPSAERGGFGTAVAAVPDADGDGVEEVLVGASFEVLNPINAGRAYVFSGASGALLHTLNSPNPQASGRFGFAVSGVPDLDGDGRGDLLIGAYNEGFGGRAYVFSGATGALRRTLVSPDSNPGKGAFGGAVAGVEDLDGDGRGDLLIGAYGEDDGGHAYAFSGATGVRLHTLTAPPDGGGRFGWAVAAVPDADGDGRPDLLVGAREAHPGPSPFASGRAYLFSGATGLRLHTLASPDEEENAYFGATLSGVEDLDGDGRGDLLVGAHNEDPDGGPGNAGRAYVFSGASGALLHALRSPDGEINGIFGWAVAGTPDLDGDSRGDLLVGAPGEGVGGRAYVFSGAASLLSLNAAALNSPVARGERLRAAVALTNAGAAPLTAVLGGRATSPGGLARQRRLGSLTAGPGQTAVRAFEFFVPPQAPLGSYTAEVGAFVGGALADSAAFAFEVVAAPPAAPRPLAPAGIVTDGAETVALDGFFPDVPASEAIPEAAIAPNPASARAAVTFALSSPSAVRLTLYDGLGRRVAGGEAGFLPAGRHRLALDVSALPSGVYGWRLVAERLVAHGRLTVAR
jgi:hypothetical protein